ncbi:MAG TPA: DUF1631 family protein [Ramlibacter sp.]|jgi:hypothetical protein|uniref:DUF1631 family protein n=1 Tax=Ramlibacter sp. TaxID=1917967 RepID=UPI002D60BE6A|nr:DUF1631 family protein [Ramlibacter sp.]HZY17943.1 DUF1631 family protein [Ramlibacter sp.]
MPVTASSPSLQSVYRACIKEAAADGRDLMQRAIRRVQASLADRTARAPDAPVRQAVHEAITLLGKHEPALCVAYPQMLLTDFAQAISGHAARQGAGALSFAELELVDDAQVQESVEVLRTQQSVASAVEAELVQLSALVCAAQGLRTVQSDRNPLRPDTYVRSLRSVLQQSPVSPAIRLRWLQFLGEALGPELAATYGRLCAFLRAQGVSEAGFQIVAAPASGPRGGDGGAAMPAEISTLLTVRALQRLLAGEGDGRPTAAAPMPSAAPAPADHPVGFAETVPAAVEVLQEMRQVESVMQRLRRRESLEAAAGGGSASLRESLRREVHRPGQALALEVVSLMVENLAGDDRLLPSVRTELRALEPALLRLALKDPRFFSDRRHPARRFLEEMTTRSLAWQAEDEPGYDGFIGPLREAVEALVQTHVEGAEPYEFAVQTLDDAWTRGQSRERRHREKAVRALLKAEQRNLLASRLGREIEGRADLAQAPAEVSAFLLGPWVQVMAQAQLADAEGQHDPGGYRAAVPELLWSVLPHSSMAAATRLGRTLPGLLDTLQRGLRSIGYAQVQIRRFLDALAALHQRALKGLPAEPVPAEGDLRMRGREELERLLGPVPLESESWLAPSEQQQTGFMESVPGTEPPLFAATEAARAPSRPAPLPAADPDLPLSLQPGSWVELLLDGSWSRWQLSWISPHRTLLMFTAASGKSHSMTPKLASAMAQSGSLRLVSGQAVVDGALDAIAGAALLNSAEFKL